MTYEEALASAARLFGVEIEYQDIWGRRHVAPAEVQRAILESLGVSCASAGDLERAIEDRLWRQWSRPLPPVVVVSEDAPEIAVRVPRELASEAVMLDVQWESGEREHHRFCLSELHELETAGVHGREFVSKRLPLPALRLGYHSLQLALLTQGQPKPWASARFIVAPQRAYSIEGRHAGLAVSLYGLRSARNWGCGDFSDLCALIDWASEELGAAFIALNPLHAIPNRQPYNTSPYLPQCGYYRNLIYLDVELVGQITAPAEAAALRASELIKYERVYRLKLGALKALFRRFLHAGGCEEFDRWIDAEGELLYHYAVFCALDEAIHKQNPAVWVWTEWPAEFRDPCSPAVREFAARHSRSVLFYKWVQWHIDRQLARAQAHALSKGMRIGLYHDLALATDRFGADLWAHRRFYVAGCRVGSPPDDFAPTGQDWSFPPPAAEEHRQDGYRLFIESIRHNARHGGALRIDHVMRFWRLYWIPGGLPATQGAYVRDYAEDLLRILALESVRGGFLVVGEDLGTVPDEVRRALHRFGILSYRLFWFERWRRAGDYPQHAAVSTTTHDLPTLAGYWLGRDIESRRAAGLIDDGAYQKQLAARAAEKQALLELLGAGDADPRDAVIHFLLSTPSALMVLNQEDLTGETEQQNLPGSTWQYPNWQRKMRYTLEELRTAPEIGELAAKFRGWLRETGR